MTTETYDNKQPPLPSGLQLGGEDELPPMPSGLTLGEKKNLGGNVSSPTSSQSPSSVGSETPFYDTSQYFEKPKGPFRKRETHPDTPKPKEDKGVFGYRTLFQDPEAEKNKFIKPLPPKTIESGVKQDKKVDTGVTGYIFNTIVDGVADLVSGLPEATNAVLDAGYDLIDKAAGTPGLSKRLAKQGGPLAPIRAPEGEDIREGMKSTFGVNTEYKPEAFDVTNGIQASDIKTLAVEAPRQLLDMAYGAATGGGSFFLQSISQNAKELNENPNAKNLSSTERLTYLYTQGAVQAALEKFSLDKILKSTGLSQKVKQKISNEITQEFIKKGKKVTAKEIEEAAFKKASSFASKAKNVGAKAATSFGVEAGTEAAQQGASDAMKLMVGSKVFDTEDITTNFVKNVVNAGVQGGVFGGVLGGGVGALSNTNKAIRNEISKVQTPEDVQKIQSDIATQVELGNITQEEAEAANITAQQYAEIASTIPQEINAEKKYALIGGIEQREQLKKEIENVNSEMGYLDPAFHEEPKARIGLLNAKLEQTNDYIDGLVADKKVTYKKDGDAFFKTMPNGEVRPISKEHYDLGVAIREEEAAKNKKPEIKPEDRKSFTFTHDEDVPTELENVKPVYTQEVETEDGPKVEVTYTGEQLIKAGLAEKEVSPEEMIVEEAKKGTLGFYNQMVKDNPDTAKDVLLDYAKQKYGVLGDGSVDKNGGAPITNKEADAAATKAYPDKQSTVDAVKAQLATQEQPVTQETQASEGAAGNVVPSLKGKEKINEHISQLTEDNYLLTHVTTEENARNITEGGMSVGIGTGISSTLTSAGAQTASNQIERLINGEVVHRDANNNSVAVIAVPKAELDKMEGKSIADKFENWLIENGHLNEDKSKMVIPKEFHAGYLSGDTFVQNKPKEVAAQPTQTSSNVVPSLKDVESTTKAVRDAVRDDYTVMYGLNNLPHEVSISEIDKKSKTNSQTIDEAVENIKNGKTSKSGETTPLLVANNDGTYSISDGFHRIAQAITDGKDKISAKVVYENELQVSKAYHKAKKDGSNPELVKAVEELLGQKPTPQTKDGGEKVEKTAETTQLTENEAGEGVPPTTTPPVAEGTENEDKSNKALATRLVNAKNVPEAAKEGIRAVGLTYEPQSQQEAEEMADAIIDYLGIDEAVLRARAQEFGGDVNTLVQTQALNQLAEMSDKATNPQDKLLFDKQFAEVGIQLDEWLRKQGRGIAALNFFYKKSPLGMQMIENATRKKDFDQWSKPKDKSWKEFFDEMMKDPEFETLVKEEVKKERADERKEKKDKVHKAIDDAAKKWADKLKPKHGGADDASKAGLGVDEIMKAVSATMKAAYDAGEAVAKVVQDAIDYISAQLGHDTWGTDEFRKEWEDKLKDKVAKKKLTDEEIKAKVLDRFRKKLKGLSDDQKDEVVRRAFKEIVENGGLDYEDFRKIISDVTGRGPMTDAEAAKLKELVKTMNSVEDAATKARTDRNEKSLSDYKRKQLEAGRASKELSLMLYNKPNVLKRLTSIMQLNTLGIPALVNNPIYNIWNQTTLRFPIGVFNSLVDGTISAIAKSMGKKYTSETNVVIAQKEFFKKLGLGFKEAGTQFFTGLDRQDYTQKELQGQQIRPLSSLMDLWSKSRRKQLTKAQIADKAIQASPQGWIAEGIARVLNLGDKPQRFAAEGAQAAAFSKALGISDIDYKLFIEFPREEAYRQYKAKGLSDADAGKKADYVRDTIVKEGQRSTFQQDNFLNDLLNKIFGGEQSGAGSLAKAVAISPYIKIPSNAFWSYFNLVNPEVAILQSVYYGTKAVARQKDPNVKFPFDKDKSTAAKDYHEARYWLAHAAVGIAMRSVITGMVLAGVFRSSNDDDETKKEREGEKNYEAQGGVNANKLAAWLRGGDPSKVKGGLVIGNRWFGHWGSVGNTIAKRYEEMTPEQKEAGDTYWNMIGGNLQLSSLEELQQGVFSNSSSMMTALENPSYGMKRWGLSTIGMFTNILHPAAAAQLSRAEIPYVSQTKADTFGQELKNSMLQRSSWLRKATGQYPPSKVSIWGEKIDRTKDNFAQRLFGWNNVDKDAFARPIYDDVVRTNDIGYFPPSVKPEIEKMKLNVEQASKLETYIGQARKGYIAPFINDQATIDGFDVKYSQLTDPDKKYVLQYLYGLAKDDGEERFLTEFPAMKKEEVDRDYDKEVQKEVFKLLQKYK